MLNQIAGGAQPARPFAESGTAGSANNGTTAMQDAADIIPGLETDAVTAVHHALIAFIDGVDDGILV